MNSEQGAELGKALGYENGYWWGKVTGGIVSLSLSSLSSNLIVGFTGLKICGTAAMTGVGYLLGGSYGAKRGADHCELKGRELAKSNHAEEEVYDEITNVCESDSVIQGLIGGIAAGLTIGALPLVMAYFTGNNSDSALHTSAPSYAADALNNAVINLGEAVIVGDNTTH